jgi:hypothetical protein
MKYLFRFLMFSLLLASCNSKVEPVKPVREVWLPEGAFWVADAEDGNWFKIEELHSDKNNARISIFSGRNGVRLASKTFYLKCSKDNQAAIQDLETEIKSYADSKIYLKSGCWLE